ncbi:MAG: GDSL-type esterase/lipase family protein [Candidatus Omnitrophota bacterium]|nr:GDSL-type esterase/lipase family protein [Candidatus Omnitrophota bacterium]
MRKNSGHGLWVMPCLPAGRGHGEKVVLVALGLLLIATFVGCAKREIKNIDSKGQSIICFGDSITFGYGANPGEDYPTALTKFLSEPVINAGVDGDTTREALKRIQADCLDKEPRLVIVEFCGNDFLKKVPFEETKKNLAEITDRLQAGGAMVAIVDISSGMFLKQYRNAYKKIAREKGAIFIPSVLSKIITNPSMKSDFLHPNAKGYQLVAERIAYAIAPYLQKNAALRKFTVKSAEEGS